MVAMPNFVLLGIFVLSCCRTCLARAPRADSSALALRAVFTASIQYFWVSRCDVESSEKLILRTKLAGFGDILWSKIQENIEFLHDLVGLLIVKVSVHPVVEGYIPENPLIVRNLKNLGYKLLGPVLPI